jgi:uncharacterized alkaline shock family protein YloU
MARFKKIPQIEEGKIFYSDEIVDNIVLFAVREIPYVTLDDFDQNQSRSNSIRVRKEKDGIHVEVEVKIHFTQSVSDIAFKIQESIRHTVETMTEHRVASVNVNICGVTFEDKMEDISNTNNLNNQEG